jgi:DNA topoisomerase-1
LHETMGTAFTAKHFRTWGGSVAAFAALAHGDAPLTIKQMTQAAADVLGNTPAISRKSYIHPRLIDICTGDQAEWRKTLRLPRATRWLSREERGLIALLRS